MFSADNVTSFHYFRLKCSQIRILVLTIILESHPFHSLVAGSTLLDFQSSALSLELKGQNYKLTVHLHEFRKLDQNLK